MAIAIWVVEYSMTGDMDEWPLPLVLILGKLKDYMDVRVTEKFHLRGIVFYTAILPIPVILMVSYAAAR